MRQVKTCFSSLLSLFTRFPVGSGDIDTAASCSWLSPLFGFLIGVLEAIPVLLYFTDPLVRASLWFVLHVAITGGIHLDGVLDYFDAILPGLRGERALKVMKDPRKGSGALLAIVTYSLLFVSVAATAERLQPLYMVLLDSGVSFATAYTVSLLYLSYSPREPYRGLARRFQDALEGKRLTLVATGCIAILPALLFDTAPSVAGCIAALITGYLVYRDSLSRIGFVNGDVAGAIIELSRLAYLSVAAFTLSFCAWFKVSHGY